MCQDDGIATIHLYTSLPNMPCETTSRPAGHRCYSAELYQVGARAENTLVLAKVRQISLTQGPPKDSNLLSAMVS